MIDEISIRGLGVIDEAVFRPGEGFTALTGETGAGKTMVVTALGLLLGKRADTAIVRTDHEFARVEGRWIIDAHGDAAAIVRSAGGELDVIGEVEGAAGSGVASRAELVVARTISSEGRSRCFVGGCAVPASVLARLSDHLVTVHGQAEQLRLRSAPEQRLMVDRFAGAAALEVLDAYTHAYARWHENSAELDELTTTRDQRLRREENLRFALAEIRAVDPLVGEDAELAQRADRMRHAHELRGAAVRAREALSGESGDGRDAVRLIDQARLELDAMASRDVTLAPMVEALTTAGYELADIASQLAAYSAGLEAEGVNELDAVETRRAEISGLIRKYGGSLDDVLDYARRGDEELSALEQDPDRIDTLTEQLAEDFRVVTELAERLTVVRAEAAERLSAQVTEELAALAMPDARLIIRVESKEALTASGRDNVEIFLHSHAGSPPRPLAKGASGGELSRVMLAMEVVTVGSDPTETIIFDEVDAGVGGAAATQIGRRLRALAESSQVIAVTHLAQVAAFAENHVGVVKSSDGLVTASNVRRLEGSDREAEMARLLSGMTESSTGLAHARELLAL